MKSPAPDPVGTPGLVLVLLGVAVVAMLALLAGMAVAAGVRAWRRR